MRMTVFALLLAAAVGCGGPTPADPKAAGGKEDPRLKRAGQGDAPGATSASKGPDALKGTGGKGAQ